MQPRHKKWAKHRDFLSLSLLLARQKYDIHFINIFECTNTYTHQNAIKLSALILCQSIKRMDNRKSKCFYAVWADQIYLYKTNPVAVKNWCVLSCNYRIDWDFIFEFCMNIRIQLSFWNNFRNFIPLILSHTHANTSVIKLCWLCFYIGKQRKNRLYCLGPKRRIENFINRMAIAIMCAQCSRG